MAKIEPPICAGFVCAVNTVDGKAIHLHRAVWVNCFSIEKNLEFFASTTGKLRYTRKQCLITSLPLMAIMLAGLNLDRADRANLRLTVLFPWLQRRAVCNKNGCDRRNFGPRLIDPSENSAIVGCSRMKYTDAPLIQWFKNDIGAIVSEYCSHHRQTSNILIWSVYATTGIQSQYAHLTWLQRHPLFDNDSQAQPKLWLVARLFCVCQIPGMKQLICYLRHRDTYDSPTRILTEECKLPATIRKTIGKKESSTSWTTSEWHSIQLREYYDSQW